MSEPHTEPTFQEAADDLLARLAGVINAEDMKDGFVVTAACLALAGSAASNAARVRAAGLMSTAAAEAIAAGLAQHMSLMEEVLARLRAQ